MDNIKPEKCGLVVNATAWLNDNLQGSFKDCHDNVIDTVNVSYLKDDYGKWVQRNKLLKGFISTLKNPVMLIKEFNHDFVKVMTPGVRKFGVGFKKQPCIGLGMSLDGNKVLKGITDGYYFYQSDLIRFVIFEDGVETEEKMRGII